MAYPEKALLRSLYEGGPIKPRHRPAPTIDSGTKSPSLISDHDRQFFIDFAQFGVLLNSDDGMGLANFNMPWRLQERPETELKISAQEYPAYGRAYDVFYNQAQLGILELSAGFHYASDNPCVRVCIELDHARLISFQAIRWFLVVLAYYTQLGKRADEDDAKFSERHLKTDREIDLALLSFVVPKMTQRRGCSRTQRP